MPSCMSKIHRSQKINLLFSKTCYQSGASESITRNEQFGFFFFCVTAKSCFSILEKTVTASFFSLKTAQLLRDDQQQSDKGVILEFVKSH